MKAEIHWLFFVFAFLQACGQGAGQKANVQPDTERSQKLINPKGNTVAERFNPPDGFRRMKMQSNSFAEYLKGLPLKSHNSRVLYYNEKVKPNNGIYAAVVDLPIGNKNLHQCADAVIRLRAEYLWGHKKYDSICFNFTNGFQADYSEWMKGKRIVVKRNKSYWVESKPASNTHQDFRDYWEIIYTYAGTQSLSGELKPVDPAEMKIGDIFIQGGSPGHAVIVVDMALNPESGEKVFLLAQSYMPAQEIQILQNPECKHLSPWYSANNQNKLITPEWTFQISDLKRFDE